MTFVMHAGLGIPVSWQKRRRSLAKKGSTLSLAASSSAGREARVMIRQVVGEDVVDETCC